MSLPSDSPAVDVVMPVRTGTEYLPEAVASVLAQEGVSPRIVVVDDGADTDLARLLAHTDPRTVRILTNSGPPGVGAARNTGVASGTAELIAFLDADDTWPAGRCRDLLDALGPAGPADGAVDLVFGAVVLTDRDGRPVGRRRAPTAGGTLLRRRAWDRVGPFAVDLPAGEFIDWVSRARAEGVAEGWTPADVLMRRSHDGNMTRTAPVAAYVQVARAHLRRSVGP